MGGLGTTMPEMHREEQPTLQQTNPDVQQGAPCWHWSAKTDIQFGHGSTTISGHRTENTNMRSGLSTKTEDYS